MFVIVEVVFALTSRSQSVLMDAAYDGAEMVVIGLSLALTPLFYKPISEQHPFGYAQVESAFTVVKSLMMLSVMLGLTVNVIQTALSGGAAVNYSSVSLFQLVLAGISACILLVMYKWNKKASSPTVRAELLGWKVDVTYSLGLASAFFLAKLVENTPIGVFSPYFDQIVAIMVVAAALPESIKLLKDSVCDIFLFSPGDELTEDIKAACGPVMDEYGYEPVFYDVTRTGRRIWASVYFDTRGDSISMTGLDSATRAIGRRLSDEIGDCVCELIPTTPHIFEKISNPEA